MARAGLAPADKARMGTARLMAAQARLQAWRRRDACRWLQAGNNMFLIRACLSDERTLPTTCLPKTCLPKNLDDRHIFNLPILMTHNTP
jgi:hypothetical protein